MAKTKVKGTILEQGSGTNYTAVAQITNFAVTGGQTETVETRTLDGTVGIEYSPTGYTETGSVTFSLIHDLALAVLGAVGITRTKYLVPVCLIADGLGMIFAALVVKLMF